MACAPRGLRSAWASTQSDQSLCCALYRYSRLPCFFMRTTKTGQTGQCLRNFVGFVMLRLKFQRQEGYFSNNNHNWAPSSEFVSSSIPSSQILTAHAQPFRGARDLAFCLKVPLGSLLVWASSEGSGETARMRRLAWTVAARIGDKHQIRLTRSNYTNVFEFQKRTECRLKLI